MGLELILMYILLYSTVFSAMDNLDFFTDMNIWLQIPLVAVIAYLIIVPVYLSRENTIVRYAGVYQSCAFLVIAYLFLHRHGKGDGEPWLLKTTLIAIGAAIIYRVLRLIRYRIAEKNGDVGDSSIEKANAWTFILALVINLYGSFIYAICTLAAHPGATDAEGTKRVILCCIVGIVYTIIVAIIAWWFDWDNAFDRREKREKARIAEHNARVDRERECAKWNTPEQK